MSMSTHVCGFKPPDEAWAKMKAVFDACAAAGVEVPPTVNKFFEYGVPDQAGVEVSRQELEKLGAVRQYCGECSQGYEVDLAKLPKDIKIIRFWNSY